MKNREISFIEFIVLIALSMALVSAVINMLLPAFQDITNAFQLNNKNQIQLSVSLLYLGLGVSQLFYGQLSDTIGRKPTIYLGLLIFILGCFVSFKANNLNILLIGQVIQGMGLGAPRVMSVAIVRDKFEGNKMARVMSFIMIIFVLTPIISPIVGKSILRISSWRTLFIVFMVLGLLICLLFKFRMPETLEKQKRNCFTLRHTINAAREVLTSKCSFGYIIILGLFSGVFITYLNLSQAILEFQYHLGDQYPYYFAGLAFSIGLASYANGKLVNRLGMKTLTKSAIIVSLIITSTFIVVNYFITPPLWMFVVFMFLQLFSYGILIGNLSALAMQPLGHIAGLGASVVGAVSTLIAVPLSIYIGGFYNNSALPLVVGFFMAATVSMLIFNFVNRIYLNEKYNSKQFI